jgi:hypothetical protein
MFNRRFSEEQLREMMDQLGKYKAGLAPYNVPYGGESFDVRAWWESIGQSDPRSLVLVQLALLLLDIVPHAADVERIFSMLGWFHGKHRSGLGVDNTGMMATIAQHYLHQQIKPGQLTKKRKRAGGDVVHIEVEPEPLKTSDEDRDSDSEEPEQDTEFDIVGEQDIDEFVKALTADVSFEAAALAGAGPAQVNDDILAGQFDGITFDVADLLRPWKHDGINVDDAALDPFQTAPHQIPVRIAPALGDNSVRAPLDIGAWVDSL